METKIGPSQKICCSADFSVAVPPKQRACGQIVKGIGRILLTMVKTHLKIRPPTTNQPLSSF